MSNNENLDIKRHGIDGEALYCKLSAISEAYYLIAEAGKSLSGDAMVGLSHFRHQTIDELEQYIFGKKEQSEKDGE